MLIERLGKTSSDLFMTSYLHIVCIFVTPIAMVLITIFDLHPLSPMSQKPRESQQEEPPTDNQDIEPGRERERTPPIEGEKGMEEHFVFHV